jgi:cation transport regulator ChaC
VAVWIFGYGSLIWRPGFPFEEKLGAAVHGYERRLDQGSPDHRGTPERLGRVANLVPATGRRTEGVCYRLADAEAPTILAALDVREQGGYERVEVEAVLARGGAVTATTWIAPPHNLYHLGAAPIEVMAAQIRAAVGPSGTNLAYVISLREALAALGAPDAHVDAVVEALRRS